MSITDPEQQKNLIAQDEAIIKNQDADGDGIDTVKEQML